MDREIFENWFHEHLCPDVKLKEHPEMTITSYVRVNYVISSRK
jgi:hypothetical protein